MTIAQVQVDDGIAKPSSLNARLLIWGAESSFRNSWAEGTPSHPPRHVGVTFTTRWLPADTASWSALLALRAVGAYVGVIPVAIAYSIRSSDGCGARADFLALTVPGFFCS